MGVEIETVVKAETYMEIINFNTKKCQNIQY